MNQVSVLPVVPADWMELEGIRVAVVDVTPEIASRWLVRNHPQNRSCTTVSVDPFAADMERGDWRFTHQGLCFDGEWRLIDGQTRLRAVIQSGTTQRFLVCQIPNASLDDPLDMHRKRSIAFLLRRSPKAVACTTVLRALQRGSMKMGKTTVGEARTLFETYEESFRELSVALPECEQLVSGFMAASIFSWPLGKEKIRVFARQVLTGEMIGTGDPAFTLRTWRERVRYNPGAWDDTMAALTCLRAALLDEKIAKIQLELREDQRHLPAYRWICSQLRSKGFTYAPEL